MKNLLIILFVGVAQLGFGQKSDTTKVYWINKNTKYSEYWASTSEKTGFEINESTALKIKIYYNKKGEEISFEEFFDAYGQKEVDNITFAISLLNEGQELLDGDKTYKNNNKYKIIGYSRPNGIKVDTSIYIDFTTTATQLDSLMNSKALLDFYNLLTPPPHGGDPNYATIAVVIDANGKAIHTHIVEDVKNKCNDNPWKLATNKEITFSPLIINGKPYITEYVFKITDLMYCVPVVYKSTSKRKTFLFSDTTFEIGAVHRIKINYSYCHPPLYVDENQPIYDSIADFLKRNPNIKIEVSSHTDQRGTDKYNLLLSERRAENIMKQVIKLGVDSNQITSMGYGEEKPIIKLDEINKMTTSDVKEAAYALNRRTELVITNINEQE